MHTLLLLPTHIQGMHGLSVPIRHMNVKGMCQGEGRYLIVVHVVQSSIDSARSTAPRVGPHITRNNSLTSLSKTILLDMYTNQIK